MLRVMLWWLALVGLLELTRGHDHSMLIRAGGLCLLWALTRDRRIDVIGVAAVTVLAFEPLGLGVALAYALYTPHYIALLRSPERSVVPIAFAMSFTQIALLTEWATPLLDHPAAFEWALLAFGTAAWTTALLLIRALLRRRSTLGCAAAVCIVPAFELIRAHTPGILLPYHLSVHSLEGSLVTLQAAEIIGVIGISWLISATSFLVARAWMEHASTGRYGRFNAVALATLVMAPNIFGWLRWTVVPPRVSEEVISVRISQGQAPSVTAEQLKADIATLIRGTSALITILPENTLIENLDVDTTVDGLSVDAVSDIIKGSGQKTALLAGVAVNQAPIRANESRYRHALVAIDPDGRREYRDKLMIAAVGDHPPFDRVPVLASFGRWLTDRTDVATLEQWSGSVNLGLQSPVAVCLCVEHLVPLIWHLKPLEARPLMQICLTDISAYGYSATQFQQSRPARRLRAIELRTAFVYVANGGSEYLDPRGRVIQMVHHSTPHAHWSVSSAADVDAIITLGSSSRPLIALALIVITAVGGCSLLLTRPVPRNRQVTVAPST